jgi:hypothetical protein
MPGLASANRPSRGASHRAPKEGGGGDRQNGLTPTDVGDGVAHEAKGRGKRTVEPAAGRRERQSPGGAMKQGDAQLLLERADLMADGGLGDVELLSRLREAEHAGGRDEHSHSGQ